MKQSKKYLSLILSLVFVILLTACSNSNDNNSKSTEITSNIITSTTEQTTLNTKDNLKNSTNVNSSKYPSKDEYLNRCKEDLKSNSLTMTNITTKGESVLFDVEFFGEKIGNASALSSVDKNDENYGRIVGIQSSIQMNYANNLSYNDNLSSIVTMAIVPHMALINNSGIKYDLFEVVHQFGNPREIGNMYVYENNFNGITVKVAVNKSNLKTIIASGDCVTYFDSIILAK